MTLIATKFVQKLLILLLCLGATFGEDPVYMCTADDTSNSDIYCKGGPGSILETILVKHKIVKDTKDFVDMPLKKAPSAVLEAFGKIDKTKKDDVAAFLKDNFSPPETELDVCNPPDWKERPKTLLRIKDPNYRDWALKLHERWKTLCRKMKADIQVHAERHSLLFVPNMFIIPGGRFREFYYWDTYWIIKGLLRSEMRDTAKGMIKNLAEMAHRFGFVPNGGRVYYLKRSQPPLLIPMVYDYILATGDINILAEPVIGKSSPPLIEVFIQEFTYWIKNTAINVTTASGKHTAFRYITPSNTPRPESYNQDVETADAFSEGYFCKLYE